RPTNLVLLVAVPGRAQPPTVGLPASAPIHIGAPLVRRFRSSLRVSKHAVETHSLSGRVPFPMRGNGCGVSERVAAPLAVKRTGENTNASSQTRNQATRAPQKIPD